MAQCDVQDLMDAAACFMCLEPKALMAVRATLLCQILQQRDPMAACDPTTLMAAARCFDCLDLRQLSVIQTQLLCELLQIGGLSSCLLCADTDPTVAPPCTCALAYNTQSGTLFIWDATAAAWIQILA